MEPCQCCKDKKSNPSSTWDGYGFNHLEGDVREWAKDHQMARSEYCVRVKGGRRFGGPAWIKRVCGDGRMGFSTRRKGRHEVLLELGLEGQLKKKRSTLINRKSSRAARSRMVRRVDGSKFSLASTVEIDRVQQDIQVVRAKLELVKIKNQKWRQLTRREKRERGERISRLQMVAIGLRK